MKQSIFSGYFGGCTEPTNPREPFKFAVNPKIIIGTSSDELIERYKGCAKEAYPDLVNQFADFVPFDDSFIEDTLKKGLILFGGYSGALRFSDIAVQMAFTTVAMNAISKEYAEDLLRKKNLSQYWEADGFSNRMVNIIAVEPELIDQWRSLNS